MTLVAICLVSTHAFIWHHDGDVTPQR